ncbi:hypothetical protein [Massilia sp. DD77]|uniref:hypothetical protein n=1 Tax=Massilia sp. DD77 TaxID=3109349 RepID=UPI002FFD96D8
MTRDKEQGGFRAELSASRQSTLEPLLQRREALFFALLCLAISFSLMYTTSSGWLRYLGAACGLLCGLTFGVCALLPGRHYRGIVLLEDGFDHFAGVWGKRTLRYADIDRIVAIQTGGGDEGDAVLLEVHCGKTRRRVTEHDFYGTDLHRVLFALPGFKPEQYRRAAGYRLRALEHVTFKRFVVFERP